MKDILIQNPAIQSRFSDTELDDLLNPEKYLGTISIQLDNLLKDLKRSR
jgi:hypothetical protein